eukprot:581896-Ditylum_brightwellii.AAC.1
MFCGNMWWHSIRGSRQVMSTLRSFPHYSDVRTVVAREYVTDDPFTPSIVTVFGGKSSPFLKYGSPNCLSAQSNILYCDFMYSSHPPAVHKYLPQRVSSYFTIAMSMLLLILKILPKLCNNVALSTNM